MVTQALAQVPYMKRERDDMFVSALHLTYLTFLAYVNVGMFGPNQNIGVATQV